VLVEVKIEFALAIAAAFFCFYLPVPDPARFF